MRILSIETSCDDTAISILKCKGEFKKPSFQVLSNFSNSQIKIHAPYGGVYPMLAKREHIKNLPILLEKALKKARLDKKTKPVDIIAVTYGPGLEIALWTGITFAKDLAKKWNVPLMPVNHMEGHILSPFGKARGKFTIPKIDFPILSLLVSGGHTELILSQKWSASSASPGLMQYKIIGETLDDAAGEAYDKVARMLGLPYPGGPKISKLAEEVRFYGKGSRKYVAYGTLGRSDGDGQRKFSAENFRGDRSNILSELIKLPRPMMYSKDFNFSFSGLKTAVLYLIKKIGPPRLASGEAGKLNEEIKSKIALEFENAVIDVLVYKTMKAKEKYKAKTIIVAGGVACNKHLKRQMKKAVGKNIKLFFPEKELTIDNSIMIGMAGYLQFSKNNKKSSKLSDIKAKGNLRFK
ncbi:MAG: putative tRNA threonylcarbamoyladenosine biosynthesis protein Gcp [Candidatus Nomurabacteria bacterium GW2011_GWF2_35_12]|uniref:tRNA N6-adenosine threonylcarbamoyltransferase n=3 Tax=Candidatus Nomuraibacteriota TaxID=1752729 RepID=A0A0G0H0Z2_9BACT|nr:MAG: putative tRNA threonylcarbamoyladenosine biosynthesis protein Gcp [Candidatus Nomurabacteria bacterium GW2011_GWF2_35_12]KKP73018.1 MAG: putative tRNA threonylcarbamoyladenosine biosynthesis protein Gcp [Candidatus Nomurabacteria bacterium GW2011_GWB1_35_20]KKP76390.1 MAG: putative tRNA threonylcarbamoyladenosine biosynthesis protein Gcp [Parcubacteria group bacterium GW2011_GWC1_35_21]KKP85504.1 MAG: putative tRNA threonylcarbamoyladenosine biosynthesis protein Gcp [Parcubacteria group 